MNFSTKKILIVAFISLITLNSCNDDFSINGEWQDITMVYGLLNSSDTAQYIKINKAFLGEGDVYEMAQVSDSIQYSAILDVSLFEYKIIDESISPYEPGNWERTTRDAIQLLRTNEIPKDTGVFANDENYLYKTNEQILEGYKYILEIINPETGKKVWSETYMISKLVVSNPKQSSYFKIFMNKEVMVYKTEWKAAVFGKVYQVALRFNYYEVLNYDTTKHSVLFNYDEQTINEVREPGKLAFEMKQKIGGVDFYERVANSIFEKPGVVRIAGRLDFIYYVGGQSYSTYMSVSKSGNNYGQSSTAYSNIKNGKGLFDCRYKYDKIDGIMLTYASIDSLNRGRYTKHLNFVNFTIDYE